LSRGGIACKQQQAVPKQASANGSERPGGGATDPGFPGSIVIGRHRALPTNQDVVHLRSQRIRASYGEPTPQPRIRDGRRWRAKGGDLREQIVIHSICCCRQSGEEYTSRKTNRYRVSSPFCPSTTGSWRQRVRRQGVPTIVTAGVSRRLSPPKGISTMTRKKARRRENSECFACVFALENRRRGNPTGGSNPSLRLGSWQAASPRV
jgi:hypothetical protein